MARRVDRSLRLRGPGLVAGLLLLVACGRADDKPWMPAEPVRTPEPGTQHRPSTEGRSTPTATPGTGAATAATEAAVTLTSSPSPAASATPAPSSTPAPSPTPVPRVDPTPPAPSPGATSAAPPTEPEVAALIERWRASWQSRDIQRYLDFYGQDFEGDGKNLAGWTAHKRTVFARPGNIQIEISELRQRRDGSAVLVEFVQTYRKGTYSDRGRKSLRLEPRGGDLRIVGEEFVALD